MPDSDHPLDTCAPATELTVPPDAADMVVLLCGACVSGSGRVNVLAKTESVGIVAALAGDLPTATGAAVPDDDVDEAAAVVASTEGDLGATLHALTAADSTAAPAHRPRHCASLYIDLC